MTERIPKSKDIEDQSQDNPWEVKASEISTYEGKKVVIFEDGSQEEVPDGVRDLRDYEEYMAEQKARAEEQASIAPETETETEMETEMETEVGEAEAVEGEAEAAGVEGAEPKPEAETETPLAKEELLVDEPEEDFWQEDVDPRLARAADKRDVADDRFNDVRERVENADTKRSANAYRRDVERQARANRAEQRKYERVAKKERKKIEKEAEEKQAAIELEKSTEQSEVKRLEKRKSKMSEKMRKLQESIDATDRAVNGTRQEKVGAENPEVGFSAEDLKELREWADDSDKGRIDSELKEMTRKTKELDKQLKKQEKQLAKLRKKQERLSGQIGQLDSEIDRHQHRIGELDGQSMGVDQWLESENQRIDYGIDSKKLELSQRVEMIRQQYGLAAVKIGDLMLADGKIRGGLARWLEERKDSWADDKDKKALNRAAGRSERAGKRYETMEKRVQVAREKKDARLKQSLNRDLQAIFEGRLTDLLAEQDTDREEQEDDAAGQVEAEARREEIKTEEREIREEWRKREANIAKLKTKIDNPKIQEKLTELQRQAEGAPDDEDAKNKLDALNKQIAIVEDLIHNHEEALGELTIRSKELNGEWDLLNKGDEDRGVRQEARAKRQKEQAMRMQQLEYWRDGVLAKIDSDPDFRRRILAERQDFLVNNFKKEVDTAGELELAYAS
jgi:hypothetical protein